MGTETSGRLGQLRGRRLQEVEKLVRAVALRELCWLLVVVALVKWLWDQDRAEIWYHREVRLFSLTQPFNKAFTPQRMNYSGSETVGDLAWFNERDGFVEAVVRGYRKGILTNADYGMAWTLPQCMFARR